MRTRKPSFKRFWRKSPYNMGDSDMRPKRSRKSRRWSAYALWKAL